MDDSISRQAAIDILDAYQVMIENGEENPYAWARQRMSELPPVQLDIPDINVGDMVSRQKAIDAASCGCGEFRGIFAECEKNLNELPSAQQEIVRCRDCKHWDKTWTNNWLPDYHYCPIIDEVRKGDFCCRYAERRTDG